MRCLSKPAENPSAVSPVVQVQGQWCFAHRAKLVVGLLLALLVCAVHAQPIPHLASNGTRQCIELADRAEARRSFQIALARLESVLFPDGIRVALDSSTTTGEGAWRGEVAKQGFLVWSGLLGTDSPLAWTTGEAEVVIRFVPEILGRGHDALGLISLERDYEWNARQRSFSVRATISVAKAHAGRDLTPAEVKHVVMHELGHLLGLGDKEDHTRLMGPLLLGHPLERPLPEEVAAVLEIRDTVRRRIQRIQQRMMTDPGVALLPVATAA